VSERWTFGVEPLPQTVELARLLRSIAGLAAAMENDEPAVARLIDDVRAGESALAAAAPADLTPRLGADSSTAARVYVDHARDVGSFNPAFPEYTIAVDGGTASGVVTFPLAFEGPPGIVHGGVLATFFDCVIQHHNCDVGVAGKTTSLLLEFRRPTPLLCTLDYVIEREATERRITSVARLVLDGEVLCTATVQAVAGDRARLPAVSPRREKS
jgi:hypothetical protein